MSGYGPIRRRAPYHPPRPAPLVTDEPNVLIRQADTMKLDEAARQYRSIGCVTDVNEATCTLRVWIPTCAPSAAAPE